MSIDLSKVSLAPWFARGEGVCCGVYQGTPEDQGHPIDLQDPTWADAQFIALARNAFDVMMRRRWGVTKTENGWQVNSVLGLAELHPEFVRWALCGTEWPDPFTALVAADAWYTKNVEKEPPHGQ